MLRTSMRFVTRWFVLGLVLLPFSRGDAAPTPEQRQEVKALESALIRAGRLYNDGKFQESGELVRDAQKRMEALMEGGDKDVAELLESTHSRLVRAHALLELEGVELSPIKKPMTAGEPTPSPAGGLSFTKQVAPLLVAKCGRCHVNDAKGQFSMSTYAALMKGPMAGVVIFPGDPQGSRLIEVIESGDMPRGGGKLTPQELELLKSWIKAGAKFDGDSPQTTLASLARGAQPDAPMSLTVTAATGKESVSYARQVAPILVENCTGCHIGAQRPRGDFNMTNFTAFLKGGESGPPIQPGKPAESLLIQKLKGTGSGERMPLQRPPLSEMQIALIEKWISEGAPFDAPDANQDIAEVAAIAKANAASHDELSAERVKLAAQNWRLGMPNVPQEQLETTNFLLIGNVGEATLAHYGEVAEEIAPKIATALKAPATAPLMKGRVTLYFFPDRYSYAEFGKMIERRDLPKESRGHWRYTIVDAYGAMIPPKTEEYSLATLIGQQVAATHLASLGKTPSWFAEGCARTVASRIDPKDPRVSAWDEALPRVLSSMNKPDDFLTNQLPQEDAHIAAYSFARFLMKDSKRFDSLLTQLRKGAPFDQAFSQVYGGSPAQVSEIWARSAADGAKKGRSPNRRTTK